MAMATGGCHSPHPGPAAHVHGRGHNYQRIPLAHESDGHGHGDHSEQSHAAEHDDHSSEEEEDGPGEDVSLPEDIYGAAIFSAIHDGVELRTNLDQDELAKWVNALRFAFVTVSLELGYVLQLSLLGCSYQFVVAPAVRAAQEVYAEYHAECFDAEGAFNAAKWEEWGQQKQEQLCGMVLSSFWLLYLLLCLFWIAAVREFRKTDHLRQSFWDVPDARSFQEQVEHAVGHFGDGHTRRVRRLAPQVKWLLLLCLILPKHVVALTVLVVGTWWLVACRGPTELFLAVLALSFVSELGGLLFEALYPFSLDREISELKLWRRKNTHGSALQREQWVTYLRCSIIWAVVLLGPYIYLCYLQDLPWLGVLPGYAGDVSCNSYWSEQTELLCTGWSAWKGASCFPYGSADTSELPPHPEVYGQ